MDRIEVLGIACRARIGVPDQERRFPQDLLVDVSCELDFTEAIETDDFSRTVDYEEIVRVVRETSSSRLWYLIETLAGTLCDELLKLPPVRVAEVRVAKFPVGLKGRASQVAAVVRRGG
jgi:7,8-dihydroneopterin aldolase/epimerase/oxygenase